MRRMFSEKQLNEKYVKIIPAPKSTTLTDEEIELITKGVFIEGIFLNYINPVFYPAYSGVTTYYGFLSAVKQDGVGIIVAYSINKTTKVIIAQVNSFLISGPGNAVEIVGNVKVKGNTLPANPSNTGTFTLKMVDGSLAWVDDSE